MTTDAASIAAAYDEFGRRWAPDTSPLYADWALGVASDRALLDRLAALPRREQQPNLVFAAARWVGCPLLRWAQIRDEVLARWDEIVAVGAARSVQTNEPGRCATLLPPLSRLDGPLALLEVGAAAGLCLFPDRCSVEYATPDGPRRVDPPDGPSPVLLACGVDDAASVPTRMPDVIWRRGIDLHPIDTRDPDAVAWLETLVWPGPDHDTRVGRLRAAASAVASDPPEISRGDLLDLLADVARSAPREATLVVFHSAVLLYLTAEERRRFASLIDTVRADLPQRVVWLANETAGTLAAIDAGLPLGVRTDHRFVQSVDGIPIAMAGQHGAQYETRAFGTPPRTAA